MVSQTKSKKKLLFIAKVVFGVAIVALLVWYLKKIDFRTVLEAISRADYSLISLSLVALAGVWICRATILWFVMNMGSKVRWKLAAVATLMGGMMDLLIPGRSGFVLRWGIMSLKTTATKGFVLSAVVSAVLIEGIVLVIFFLTSFILAPQLGEFASSKITVAFEVLLVALVLCFLFSNWLEIQLNKTFLKKLSSFNALFDITRKLKRPKNFVIGIGLPTLSWTCNILIIFLLTRAFGLHLAIFEIIVLMFAINLAILVPVVPGNVGTIQVVITTVLVRLHYDEATSLAFSFVFHAVSALPVIVAGAILSFFFPVDTKGKSIDVESRGA